MAASLKHRKRASNQRKTLKHQKQKIAPKTTKRLKTICANSAMCIAFGAKATAKIELFFNFTDFKYLIGTRMLSSGVNGFVNELIYERDGYRANAILKSSSDGIYQAPDNLYYEGYIGLKYINRLAQQFPCFLKTYGMYMYNDVHIKATFEHVNSMADQYPDKYAEFIATIPHNVFTHLPTPAAFNAGESCVNDERYAVLLEYINAPINMAMLFNTQMTPYLYFVELPQIMFQIYAVLGTLALQQAYAHNDLHIGNILLYVVPDGKYITMTYKNAVSGTTIQFQTQYIVKFIDYGRNYITESNDIFKKICAARECAPSCGVDYGYTDIFIDAYDKLPTRFDPIIDCSALDMIAPKIIRYSSTKKHAKYNRKHLIGSFMDPISHILAKLKQVERFLTQSNVNRPYPKRTASDFAVFNKISDIEQLPDIYTVWDLYWTWFHYLHSSSIYKAYKHAHKTSNPVIDSAGEIICDLQYTPDTIRPLQYSAPATPNVK